MISTETVIELYQQFRNDLVRVRRRQYWFHQRHENPLVRRLRKLRLRRHMLFPALDDIEAEVTYLLLRARRPNVVFEMSPNAGWSTSWILNALRDNDNGGQLWSYDIHDTCTKFVPRDLAAGRWHFVQGDARETTLAAPHFDHCFIDSEHSRSFAEWFVSTLFPRIPPGCVVSVHDVFHSPEPSEEGEVVVKWLADHGLSYWTPSPFVDAAVTDRIEKERRRLGIDYAIIRAPACHNPMLFFETGAAGR